jgi:solute carrier family 8 (sodium/calcium exchanger)
MVHKIAAGNILMSAAILFNGASYRKVLRLLDSMGIKTISETTYKRHAREYLQPTVYKVWRDSQEELIYELLALPGKPEIGGDGRADSPGHCAKYGSYTALELRINKVIDVQLVQSNEVGGSYHMEQAGLERCINFLREKNLTPGVIVTDRHVSIQKWIRENLQDCTHFYDVWHVAKGLSKKIEGLAKQKECELAGQWLRSISNHMYWCAGSSEGLPGDVIAAKWLSVLRHMQNLHDGHSELFPACTHEEIEERRKWLRPNTKVYDKLTGLISNKRLLGDIKKLSPRHQTSSVEAFHSLLVQFAPKSVAFSFTGMLTRMILAAMHYNENSDRPQAVNKQKEPKFALKFPKFRKGGYCVQPIKTSATYEYVSKLMDYVLTRTLDDPSEVWQLWHQVEVPPTLCSDFERPDMSDAIAAHTSRFNDINDNEEE